MHLLLKSIKISIHTSFSASLLQRKGAHLVPIDIWNNLSSTKSQPLPRSLEGRPTAMESTFTIGTDRNFVESAWPHAIESLCIFNITLFVLPSGATQYISTPLSKFIDCLINCLDKCFGAVRTLKPKDAAVCAPFVSSLHSLSLRCFVSCSSSSEGLFT